MPFITVKPHDGGERDSYVVELCVREGITRMFYSGFAAELCHAGVLRRMHVFGGKLCGAEPRARRYEYKWLSKLRRRNTVLTDEMWHHSDQLLHGRFDSKIPVRPWLHEPPFDALRKLQDSVVVRRNPTAAASMQM